MASRVKVDEKLAPKSPAQQRARLAGLSNLVKSNKPEHLEKYFKLLSDFEFLTQKIEHPDFGVQALITDYELIDTLEESPNLEKVKALKLIQGALQLSAHILCKDNTQLAEQLLGRMQGFEVPSIQVLMSVAKQRKQTPWLRPLTASLTPPGGPLLRTLSGHSGSVETVALSPDGTKVISGSWDKTIKVWHLDTQEELLTFKGHSGSVKAVALSPDGTKVISASGDTTLKVWNLETGEELLTLMGHSGWVTAVAISPDGTKVISGSNDKTLKVWHLDTQKELLTLMGHSNRVTAVAISPDGTKVISGSADSTLKVWNLETGEELLTLKGHSGWATAVALSSDGTRVISGSDDNTLKVWNLETGEELLTLMGHSGSVEAVAISPDGTKVISGSSDNTLKIWHLNKGEVIASFTGDSPLFGCAFTPDGMTIVAGDALGRMHFLRLEGSQ